MESQRIWREARAEAEQILSQTRSDANRFREELKQKAQAEAAGIVKNAEKQIELETARALQQIRNEAVDISVAIASKLLASQRVEGRQRAPDRRDVQADRRTSSQLTNALNPIPNSQTARCLGVGSWELGFDRRVFQTRRTPNGRRGRAGLKTDPL